MLQCNSECSLLSFHTVLFVLVLVVVFGLPVAMVVIGKLPAFVHRSLPQPTFTLVLHQLSLCPLPHAGSLYVHDCAINTKLPIFLIVFGSAALVVDISLAIREFVLRVCKSRDGADCISCVGCLMGIFLFIWFFIGNYWVLSTWSTWSGLDCDYNDAGDCCHPLVMYLSCTVIAIVYGSALLGCVMCALIPVILSRMKLSIGA